MEAASVGLLFIGICILCVAMLAMYAGLAVRVTALEHALKNTTPTDSNAVVPDTGGIQLEWQAFIGKKRIRFRATSEGDAVRQLAKQGHDITKVRSLEAVV